MQANFLFTPGASDDPMLITLPEGQNIFSLWVPAPTTNLIVQVPSMSGWATLYEITQLSAEIIPLDQGYSQIQVTSGGNSGAAFWIIATDRFLSPYKDFPGGEMPLTAPFNLDLSALTWYNYFTYGAEAGGSVSANNAAMTEMLGIMSSLNSGNGGGRAFIPAGKFQINANSFSVPNQAVIEGAGCGVNGHNTAQLDVQGDGTLFSTSGPHTSGGTLFEDLAIAFSAPTLTTDTAIYANFWRTVARNVVFLNCPTALNAQAEQCGLEDCVIQYDGSYAGPNGFTAVRLSAAECFVRGKTVMLQQLGGGPTGATGISMESGMDTGTIESVHISEFAYGINYALNSHFTISHNVISGVKIDAGEICVNLTPSDSHGNIYDEKYIGCTFTLGASNTGPCVFTGSGSGLSDGHVDDISYIECTAIQSTSDGYQFHGVGSARIIGGTAAGNGSSGGAGVALTGPIELLEVLGVCLDSTYGQAQIVQFQQYAFRAGTAASGTVVIEGGSMNGYSGPLILIATPANLGTSLFVYVNRVNGYNDKKTVVLASAPTSSTSAAANNFFGLSRASFQGVSGASYTLNGTTYAVANGTSISIPLDPYDTFYTAGTLSGWNWISIWG